MMENVEISQPNADHVKILRDVLETNHAIVRQNALIIQALTLPQLIIRKDDNGQTT